MAPNATQSEILQRYSDAGGVIDFAFFEWPQNVDANVTHREAALQGVQHFWTSQTQSKEPGIYSTVPLSGKEISWTDFLGPTLDPQHPFFISTDSQMDFVGFVAAFRDPPYAMRLMADELYYLLQSFIREIFNDGKDLRITEWSTDWSPYFEDGQEWWGSFCWTVAVANRYIVTVAASTTD